jgi:hypothetical protein
MLGGPTKSGIVRRFAGVLVAVGTVLPVSLAPLPVGAATTRPPFTIVSGDFNTWNGSYQIISVPQGQSFLVSGLECTLATPYVPPTGSLVFKDATTRVDLGTVALTAPSHFSNCTTASVTDSETLAAGDYRIEATYVPGGSAPVQPSAAAAYTARVTAPTKCTSPNACNKTVKASASASYAGLNVTASGTPSSGAATMDLSVGLATLACPGTPKTPHPVADLRDTFVPKDTIEVTAIMPWTSSNAPELVCFNSPVAFLRTTSPKKATSGTGFLLACTQTKNVAPCVNSSQHIGNDVVVKFVVRGGDPRFYIVLPKGRQVWLSHFGTGRVGTAYNAQLQTSGGIAPFHWSLTSGALPQGCTLNPDTGTITGKPTTKGNYPIVVQAADSERPPQKAPMSIPITIK